jgi:hypothetical protein
MKCSRRNGSLYSASSMIVCNELVFLIVYCDRWLEDMISSTQTHTHYRKYIHDSVQLFLFEIELYLESPYRVHSKHVSLFCLTETTVRSYPWRNKKKSLRQIKWKEISQQNWNQKTPDSVSVWFSFGGFERKAMLFCAYGDETDPFD